MKQSSMLILGFIVILLVGAFTTAFSDKSDSPVVSQDTITLIPEGMPKYPVLNYGKAKVLENGTITYVIYQDANYAAYEVYSKGDTVWLNMTTHHIDDSDPDAMMVVLK